VRGNIDQLNGDLKNNPSAVINLDSVVSQQLSQLRKDKSVTPGNDQGLYQRLVNAFKNAKDKFPPSGGSPQLATEGVGGNTGRVTEELGKKQKNQPLRSQGKEDGLSTNATPAPKGLVNVVEEEPSPLGRYFARYRADGTETFSARIENRYNAAGEVIEGKDAQISWIETGHVRQVTDNLAEVQAAVGQKIVRVYGNAADGVLESIKANKFNSALYAKNLARRLGGKWKVEPIKAPNTGGEGEPAAKYTIEATKIRD
jgi:hypothetical protein